MRVLIIVLLLVLTPLRAWAANSMAVQMASQGLGNHASEPDAAPLSAHCLGMQASSPEDVMPGHMVATHIEKVTEETMDHGSLCGNCAACQVCATVALVAPALTPTATALAHHLPRTTALSFSSAALAPGQKPPIF